MTTIKIPLSDVTIDGDEKTIELPLEDVMRALESSDRVTSIWGENHRCPACNAECIALCASYGQKAYLETPYCPICGTRLMRMINEKESARA